MKRALIASMLLAPMGVAFAAPPNSVGCGLGSQIFDGQSGIIPQILAVTTNGTLGNQTFGISTGTLGCDPDGTVVASARVPMFVGANMDNLAHDMAMGKGESLESLATLMNIADADKTAFYQTARNNYGQIFSVANLTSGDVLASLYDVMRRDERLAQYVPA